MALSFSLELEREGQEEDIFIRIVDMFRSDEEGSFSSLLAILDIVDVTVDAGVEIFCAVFIQNKAHGDFSIFGFLGDKGCLAVVHEKVFIDLEALLGEYQDFVFGGFPLFFVIT